ncbi:hypothetical protein DFH27DRAFT_644809 [Peziza echinospora]|nr:hypothetical protein DFH27DRAFT_644809 [Peziza echinospora]
MQYRSRLNKVPAMLLKLDNSIHGYAVGHIAFPTTQFSNGWHSRDPRGNICYVFNSIPSRSFCYSVSKNKEGKVSGPNSLRAHADKSKPGRLWGICHIRDCPGITKSIVSRAIHGIIRRTTRFFLFPEKLSFNMEKEGKRYDLPTSHIPTPHLGFVTLGLCSSQKCLPRPRKGHHYPAPKYKLAISALLATNTPIHHSICDHYSLPQPACKMTDVDYRENVHHFQVKSPTSCRLIATAEKGHGYHGSSHHPSSPILIILKISASQSTEMVHRLLIISLNCRMGTATFHNRIVNFSITFPQPLDTSKHSNAQSALFIMNLNGTMPHLSVFSGAPAQDRGSGARSIVSLDQAQHRSWLWLSLYRLFGSNSLFDLLNQIRTFQRPLRRNMRRTHHSTAMSTPTYHSVYPQLSQITMPTSHANRTASSFLGVIAPTKPIEIEESISEEYSAHPQLNDHFNTQVRLERCLHSPLSSSQVCKAESRVPFALIASVTSHPPDPS